MSKESFNWKSLFVNIEPDKSPTPAEQTPLSNNTKFPNQVSNSDNLGPMNQNPFMGEILSVYERGFESLNVADFDFFELYKSVVSAGVTNPQSYQMAFTIGKSIKPDLSKAYLLEKSKYYLDEIEKVYAKFSATGNTKKTALDKSVSNEKSHLNLRISEIEKQINSLQKELAEKRAELANTDGKNIQEYAEIQQKIEANDYARQKIVDSINFVISGINQYL